MYRISWLSGALAIALLASTAVAEITSGKVKSVDVPKKTLVLQGNTEVFKMANNCMVHKNGQDLAFGNFAVNPGDNVSLHHQAVGQRLVSYILNQGPSTTFSLEFFTFRKYNIDKKEISLSFMKRGGELEEIAFIAGAPKVREAASKMKAGNSCLCIFDNADGKKTLIFLREPVAVPAK